MIKNTPKVRFFLSNFWGAVHSGAFFFAQTLAILSYNLFLNSPHSDDRAILNLESLGITFSQSLYP